MPPTTPLDIFKDPGTTKLEVVPNRRGICNTFILNKYLFGRVEKIFCCK